MLLPRKDELSRYFEVTELGASVYALVQVKLKFRCRIAYARGSSLPRTFCKFKSDAALVLLAINLNHSPVFLFISSMVLGALKDLPCRWCAFHSAW